MIPDVASLLNNLAELYHAQGRYAETEPLYNRALVIHEKALGPNHGRVRELRMRLVHLLPLAPREAMGIGDVWTSGREALRAGPLFSMQRLLPPRLCEPK